jgi:[glutamine synthetase] adenylyltransferase / [glutamine synthetase]-adenylyl-L-tyrosine phosphorylase
VTILKEKIDSLVGDLPDPEGARLFLERITTAHPPTLKTFERHAGLLSDALALAAWSPLLATTLIQHPDYLAWLQRERTEGRTKTVEELSESLARFSSLHSQLDPHTILARFRRRELLRIYLRDIRRTFTLVETMEELSNLADAVLAYALNLAAQELDNRYGAPLSIDERGRARRAEICIIALGKLGSRELNYASDIDLMFVYSAEGATAGGGEREATTNREYFNKLAARVARIVGEQTGEGAAYRVDLRLRPYGRVGALCCSIDEAVRYYRESAREWELQTLIRSRAAGGSDPLFAQFSEQLSDRIFRADVTRAVALGHVRQAKQQIDREHGAGSEAYNVKLGRGGIREIEFIAQALQLAYGGRDPWLRRAPHTLVSLGRLAERGFITETERAEIFDAYFFLRTLEHRLQMEQGLQTHTVPEDAPRRLLLARRMNFTGSDALETFNRALRTHTGNVRRIFDRVFADQTLIEAADKSEESAPEKIISDEKKSPSSNPEIINQATNDRAVLFRAAIVFAAHLAAERNDERDTEKVERTMRRLENLVGEALNVRRAVNNCGRIAASLEKSSVQIEFTEETLRALVQVCGASQFLSEMLAANPALISAVPVSSGSDDMNYRARLKGAVENETSFKAELAALREAWARTLIEIGARDAAGEISLRESNERQTALAVASVDAACLIAACEIARRHKNLQSEPQLAVLGLGRLGGGGMDYGSDLDVVLIYDEENPAPVAHLTPAETYAQLAELFVAALSSLTRQGYLYRVDLRLRPDGRNGAPACGAKTFINYLRERAAVWEWLAYMKIHAVGGDVELGKRAATEARSAIYEAAREADSETLRVETRRVRERLERERKAKSGIDIKFSAGGMLDVYFAMRYLQLRDGVIEINSDDRSTLATLDYLRAVGSLNEEDYRAFYGAYALLRRTDHYVRLILERSPKLPAADHPALEDIARAMNYASSSALLEELKAKMKSVRAAYDRITGE